MLLPIYVRSIISSHCSQLYFLQLVGSAPTGQAVAPGDGRVLMMLPPEPQHAQKEQPHQQYQRKMQNI